MCQAKDPYWDIRDARVERVLERHASLRSIRPMCQVRPQAATLPCPDQRNTRLVVWLYLWPHLVSLEAVCSACFATVATIIRKRLLGKRVAIEVVAATLDEHGQTDEKILRVGVLATATLAFLELGPEDLRVKSPATGVTCIWYPSSWFNPFEGTAG